MSWTPCPCICVSVRACCRKLKRHHILETCSQSFVIATVKGTKVERIFLKCSCVCVRGGGSYGTKRKTFGQKFTPTRMYRSMCSKEERRRHGKRSHWNKCCQHLLENILLLRLLSVLMLMPMMLLSMFTRLRTVLANSFIQISHWDWEQFLNISIFDIFVYIFNISMTMCVTVCMHVCVCVRLRVCLCVGLRKRVRAGLPLCACVWSLFVATWFKLLKNC